MASKHENPSGSWRVVWSEGKPKRRKSETVKNEAAADELINHLVDRAAQNKPYQRPVDVPNLEEFTARWLASKKDSVSEATLSFYVKCLETHVLPKLGHLPLTELLPKRLGEWQAERLEEGAGPAVLGKTQNVLGQILRKAVLPFEYLDTNPVDALDQPGYTKKDHHWLTATQVEALRLWFLDRDDPGSAALISVLGYVGMRPQSALALKWTDLMPEAPGWVQYQDPKAGGFSVTHKNVDGVIVVGSKTSKAKYFVYAPEQVRADLTLWFDFCPATPQNLIFPNREGAPWRMSQYSSWSHREAQACHSENYVPKCFKRAAEDNFDFGKSVTPYALRHTAATLYAAAGWNHLEVAKQLMHSPTVSLSTYQHLFDNRPSGSPKFSVDDYIREARGLPLAEREIVV